MDSWLRPLTCHRPVMPGFTVNRGRYDSREQVRFPGEHRTRPHQRHLAAQDVDQLRQLVQAGAAQPRADRRDHADRRPA